MKFLDVDWPAFYQTLEAWECLSEISQDAFLRMKPSADHRNGILPEVARLELAERGWIEQRARLFRVAESRREFNKVMRAMDRVRVLDGNLVEDRRLQPALLIKYLREHFSLGHRQALSPGRFTGDHTAIAQLDRVVGSHLWIQDFLDHSDPGRMGGAKEEESLDEITIARNRRLASAERATLDVARWLVLDLVQLGRPRSLYDVRDAFEEEAPGGSVHETRRLGAALRLLLSEVLVFASLDESRQPLLGLWPGAVRELDRRSALAAQPMATEEPADLVQRPVRVDDLLALVVECAVDPPRVKADGHELFARNSKAVIERLAPLPGWLGGGTAGFTPSRRCRSACGLAYLLGIVSEAGTPGKDLRLVLTSRGEQWAGLSPERRVRSVLDHMRHDDGTESEARDSLDGWLPFVPDTAKRGSWFWRVDLDQALVATFRRAPSDAFVRLGPFLHQVGTEENPYREVQRKQPWISEEEVEGSWLHALLDFFFQRLFAFGGVAIGASERDYVFRLTSVGRFMLGESDSFELVSVEEKPDLIVQPNLEIVLLAPSPAAGIQLAAFASPTSAQRAGDTIGNLYRLTKESVQRAAAAGYTEERLLQELRQLSREPIPQNVEVQVKAWLESVRWAEARPALLLEAADAETAARIVSAVGKGASLISETVVELPAADSLPPRVRRNLVRAGVFVRERETPD